MQTMSPITSAEPRCKWIDDTISELMRKHRVQEEAALRSKDGTSSCFWSRVRLTVSAPTSCRIRSILSHTLSSLPVFIRAAARGPRLARVEVKGGARRAGFRGLEEFGKQFEGAATMLVGEGGIPLSEFLSVPVREWLEDQ